MKMGKIIVCDRCSEPGERVVKIGPNHVPRELLKTGDLLLIPATDLIPKIMYHDEKRADATRDIEICEQCYKDLKHYLNQWWKKESVRLLY